MYGLIGKLNAVPGQRDAQATILLEGAEAMPGCLSYVIATDPADPDALWVTEVWDSPASHQASLETAPIGGHGLHGAEPAAGVHGKLCYLEIPATDDD
jgi:quinol monooxygenase YgiN